jgi:2-aminophenol/2-amino-5-chlorophenol 1,6-dioxygenase subunit alpha
MSAIEKAFIVPGLPHLAFDNAGNGPWQNLRNEFKKAGEEVQALQPDVLVIYSAQWISVLGHSFQFAANPKGVHVDENWYELGLFPFSFQIDRELTQSAERLAQAKGFATKLVDYEGFPIDTGTLVTLQYFNPLNQIPVMIVSSNIYCSQEDSLLLGTVVGEAIRHSGKRAVVINCSSLSHRFLTEEVSAETDRLARPEDDIWNRRMLQLLEQGENQKALDLGAEYAHQVNAEMGYKGFYWLMGVMGTPNIPAKILAYGPVWGTGAAIVKYDLS